MAGIFGDEERVFNHYLELPFELRTMVIDEMEVDDRCRFTQCSNMCCEEAKKSKKYLYGFKLICWSEDLLTIEIKHGNNEDDALGQGFVLTYLSNLERKVEKCVSLASNATLWEDELDNSVDLFQRAMEYLQKRMRDCEHSLKKLCLDGLIWTGHTKLLKNVNFGIERLENLEELDIRGDIDALQIFSKLQLPLKKLYVEDNVLSSQLPDLKNIYQVQEELNCWNLKLNVQHFLRLRAKLVFIRIGELTEKDIFKFVRSWQNGTIGKNIEVYQWDLRDSNFSKKTLLRFFRINDSESGPIEIKHHRKAGKSAVLLFDDRILRFNANLVEDSVFQR